MLIQWRDTSTRVVTIPPPRPLLAPFDPANNPGIVSLSFIISGQLHSCTVHRGVDSPAGTEFGQVTQRWRGVVDHLLLSTLQVATGAAGELSSYCVTSSSSSLAITCLSILPPTFQGSVRKKVSETLRGNERPDCSNGICPNLPHLEQNLTIFGTKFDYKYSNI